MVSEPGASGFCYWAIEFCSQLADRQVNFLGGIHCNQSCSSKKNWNWGGGGGGAI